jgi:hypothetical protein
LTFHEQSSSGQVGCVAFDGKHVGGQKRDDEDESHVDLSLDDVVWSRARHGRRGREINTEGEKKTEKINR